MFYAVQSMRAFAAIFVVMFHEIFGYTYTHEQMGAAFPWFFNLGHLSLFGACGVHLFFVISGFVMGIQRNEPGRVGAVTFLKKRVIRIVPMYWIGTFVMAWILKIPVAGNLTTWAKSLLFFPDYGGFPILGVGWTLNYEAVFYVAFAVVMIWARRNVGYLFALFAFFFIAKKSIDWPVLQFFGAGMVAEFLVGVLISRVYQAQIFQSRAPLIFILGWLALVSSATWYGPNKVWDDFAVIVWGIPAALIILGAVAIESWDFSIFKLKPVVLIGNASYSIYLIHEMTFYNINWWILHDAKAAYFVNSDIMVVVLTSICVALGVAVHLLIEMPIDRFLRRMFFARRAHLPAVQAR